MLLNLGPNLAGKSCRNRLPNHDTHQQHSDIGFSSATTRVSKLQKNSTVSRRRVSPKYHHLFRWNSRSNWKKETFWGPPVRSSRSLRTFHKRISNRFRQSKFVAMRSVRIRVCADVIQSSDLFYDRCWVLCSFDSWASRSRPAIKILFQVYSVNKCVLQEIFADCSQPAHA